MQSDDAVADLTPNVAGQPTLAVTSFAPACRRFAVGHLSSNLRRIVPVFTLDFIDLAVGPSRPLRRAPGAEAPGTPESTGPSGQQARQVTDLAAGSHIASAPLESEIPHDTHVAG